MALSVGINPGFSLMKSKKCLFSRNNGITARERTFDVLPQSGDSGGVFKQRDSKPYVRARHIEWSSDGWG